MVMPRSPFDPTKPKVPSITLPAQPIFSDEEMEEVLKGAREFGEAQRPAPLWTQRPGWKQFFEATAWFDKNVGDPTAYVTSQAFRRITQPWKLGQISEPAHEVEGLLQRWQEMGYWWHEYDAPFPGYKFAVEATNPAYWIGGGTATRALTWTSKAIARTSAMGKAGRVTADLLGKLAPLPEAAERAFFAPITVPLEKTAGYALKKTRGIIRPPEKTPPALRTSEEIAGWLEVNRPKILLKGLKLSQVERNAAIDFLSKGTGIEDVAVFLAESGKARGTPQLEHAFDLMVTNAAQYNKRYTAEMARYATALTGSRIRAIELGSFENLGITENMVTKSVRPAKPEYSMDWGAITTTPDNYIWEGPVGERAYHAIKEMHTIIDDLSAILKSYGIERPKLTYGDFASHFFPRGKATKRGLEDLMVSTPEGSKFAVKQNAEKGRRFMEMIEGIEHEFSYGDPMEAFVGYVYGVYNQIGRSETRKLLDTISLTTLERLERMAPGLRAEVGGLATKQIGLKDLLASLRSAKRGAWLPGATMEKVSRLAPDALEPLTEAMTIKPSQFGKMLGELRRDLYDALKVTPQQFKQAMNLQPRQSIKMADIQRGIRSFRGTQQDRAKLLDKFYQGFFRSKQAQRGQFLDRAIESVRSQLESTQEKLRPLVEESRRLRKVAGSETEEWVMLSLKSPGRFFHRDIAANLEKALDDQAPAWIRPLSKVARSLVGLQANVDLSWHFIQGIPLLGDDFASGRLAQGESIWWISLKDEMKAIRDPSYIDRFRMLHYDTYLRSGEAFRPMQLGGTEFTVGLVDIQKGFDKAAGVVGEYFEALGLPRAVPDNIAKGFQSGFRNIYGRLGTGFSFSAEAARIHYIEAMESAWRRQGGKFDALVDFSGRLTGSSNLALDGVSAFRQAVESTFLFAPSFIRSWLMLLQDITHRGVTGAMARRSIGGLLAGGVLGYSNISMMLGQTPKLNPLPKRYGGDGAEFGTIQWGNSRVGLLNLSFLMRVTRLAGEVVGTAFNEPDKLWSLKPSEWSENPVLRIALGSASPLASMTKELVTGKDPFGRQLSNPADYGQVLLNSVIPIFAQNMIESPSSERGRLLLPEMLGMRAWAMNSWDLLGQSRNQALYQYDVPYLNEAQRKLRDTGTLTWEDLEADQQLAISRDVPGLKELEEQAEADSKLFSGVDQKLVGGYFDELASVDTAYNDKTFELEQEVRYRQFTAPALKDFADKLKTEGELRWRMKQLISAKDKYGPVLVALSEPENIPEYRQFDLAYTEYLENVVLNPNLSDSFGNTLWELRDQAIVAFRQKWGETLYQRVVDYLHRNRSDQSYLVGEYARAQETLRPYWEVRDYLLNQMPKAKAIDDMLRNPVGLGPDQQATLRRHPEYADFQRKLYSMRQLMRQRNAEIDVAAYLWGSTTTLLSNEAKQLIEKELERLANYGS